MMCQIWQHYDQVKIDWYNLGIGERGIMSIILGLNLKKCCFQ